MPNHFGSIDAAELERLIAPALPRPLPAADYERLARYVDVLYRWNARMSLTAVRDLRVLARLHLAECLLAGQLIPDGVRSVLDFGSGAGLPGIPMALARSQLAITLAESQAKKAAFLREAVRELGLKNVAVFHGRVEDLSGDATFDLVALRAVDKMDRALRTARTRIASGGWCLLLASAQSLGGVEGHLRGMTWLQAVSVPGTSQRFILRGRNDLPR